ncbi:TVP38/TMEM64 family protein [Spongisporangium articulatum]|uniref:TVP38/TMEM64 family membrane protein n=1 Tax=Spongisporangium articulatum TaxID=3362603 RepID=A0ABW8ARQ4_9ACTN
MRRPALRLAVLTTALLAVALLVILFAPVSRAGLADAIEPLGWFAPAAFVVVAALLAMAFVPGPILSAASGVLFGTGLGFVVSVLSSALTSVLCLLVARRAGGAAVDELSGEKVAALADLARRQGLLVVVLQRLVPGVPDAPFSYLYGLLRLKVWQVGVGTLLGSAPRAFSYTALGDASVTGDAGLAVIAGVVGTAVSVVGAVALTIVVRRYRRTHEPQVDDDRAGGTVSSP